MTMLPGPVKEDCACGCGTFGTPTKKLQRDGLHHVGRCPCARCRAPRHKKNASRRERKIARDAGGERSPLSGALNGYDGRAGLDVWEETSAEAVVRGIRKWWQSKTVTDKIERLMKLSGVNRHLILSWDGKPRLVVTPYDDWCASRTGPIRETED